MAKTSTLDPQSIIRVVDSETLKPLTENGKEDRNKTDHVKITANGSTRLVEIEADNDDPTVTEMDLKLSAKGRASVLLSTLGVGAPHAQNTDTGTTGDTFELAQGSGAARLRLNRNGATGNFILDLLMETLAANAALTLPGVTGRLAVQGWARIAGAVSVDGSVTPLADEDTFELVDGGSGSADGVFLSIVGGKIKALQACHTVTFGRVRSTLVPPSGGDVYQARILHNNNPIGEDAEFISSNFDSGGLPSIIEMSTTANPMSFATLTVDDLIHGQSEIMSVYATGSISNHIYEYITLVIGDA